MLGKHVASATGEKDCSDGGLRCSTFNTQSSNRGPYFPNFRNRSSTRITGFYGNQKLIRVAVAVPV
jgi:hypothetical protein